MTDLAAPSFDQRDRDVVGRERSDRAAHVGPAAGYAAARARSRSSAASRASARRRARRRRPCSRWRRACGRSGRCPTDDRGGRLEPGRTRARPARPGRERRPSPSRPDRSPRSAPSPTAVSHSSSTASPCPRSARRDASADRGPLSSSTSKPTPPGRTSPRPKRLPQSVAVRLRKSPRSRPQYDAVGRYADVVRPARRDRRRGWRGARAPARCPAAPGRARVFWQLRERLQHLAVGRGVTDRRVAGQRSRRSGSSACAGPPISARSTPRCW